MTVPLGIEAVVAVECSTDPTPYLPANLRPTGQQCLYIRCGVVPAPQVVCLCGSHENLAEDSLQDLLTEGFVVNSSRVSSATASLKALYPDHWSKCDMVPGDGDEKDPSCSSEPDSSASTATMKPQHKRKRSSTCSSGSSTSHTSRNSDAGQYCHPMLTRFQQKLQAPSMPARVISAPVREEDEPEYPLDEM